ncbi:MAG: hypothetical protein CMF22_10675 [Idiomarinaceae bacterium]|nr:hypothetical protein [Idiomarinaceae bacterium]MBG23905.1 hypothetical protein [Idiomarinaceae bacterium]|tara:strand:+ start:61950 stop:62321 length:372 start_codon:yes stop_codon:yes gene_type:complete
MREQKTVEINGDTFIITSFGARKGIKLGKKVAKIVLPALGTMYSGQENVTFADVLSVVAENLDELDDKTIEELLSETTVNKYAVDYDKYFSRNYSTLFRLLWEIIEFNFADIFSELPGTDEDK